MMENAETMNVEHVNVITWYQCVQVEMGREGGEDEEAISRLFFRSSGARQS